MAKFGKNGRKCDTCGKFANNRQGEYERKDGSAGYILVEGDTDEEKHVSTRDICSDCDEKT